MKRRFQGNGLLLAASLYAQSKALPEDLFSPLPEPLPDPDPPEKEEDKEE